MICLYCDCAVEVHQSFTCNYIQLIMTSFFFALRGLVKFVKFAWAGEIHCLQKCSSYGVN